MDYTYMKEQLKGRYREVFEKTEVYGTFSELDMDVQDDRMMNLFDLLLTAQEKKKPVEKIIGPDMEKFCKEYFQEYDHQERLRHFPVDLYRFLRAVFILELIDLFVLGENTDLLHTQSNITPYLGGLVISLLFTMIVNLIVRPMIFRFRIRPIFYYIGFLLCWVGTIVLCAWLTDGMVLGIPVFPILVVSGIYDAIYLVVRSVWRYRHYGSIRRPRSEIKEAERSVERVSMEQMMLEAMLKRYKRKNKHLQKKGNKGMTPGEYTEQVRKEYKKVLDSWKWELLIFAAIVIFSVAFTAFSSTFWDTVLFALIIMVIEGGIYWFLLKAERKSNQVRREILDTCEREGISVVEYAMRKGGG